MSKINPNFSDKSNVWSEGLAYHALDVGEDCIAGSGTNRRHRDLSSRVRTSKFLRKINNFSPQFRVFELQKRTLTPKFDADLCSDYSCEIKNERTGRVERRKKERVSSPEIEGSKFRELSRRMKLEMKGE